MLNGQTSKTLHSKARSGFGSKHSSLIIIHTSCADAKFRLRDHTPEQCMYSFSHLNGANMVSRCGHRPRRLISAASNIFAGVCCSWLIHLSPRCSIGFCGVESQSDVSEGRQQRGRPVGLKDKEFLNACFTSTFRPPHPRDLNSTSPVLTFLR